VIRSLNKIWNNSFFRIIQISDFDADDDPADDDPADDDPGDNDPGDDDPADDDPVDSHVSANPIIVDDNIKCKFLKIYFFIYLKILNWIYNLIIYLVY